MFVITPNIFRNLIEIDQDLINLNENFDISLNIENIKNAS